MKRQILTILPALAIWFLLVGQWGSGKWGDGKRWGDQPWASGKFGISNVSEESASTWDGNPYTNAGMVVAFFLDTVSQGSKSEPPQIDPWTNFTSGEAACTWWGSPSHTYYAWNSTGYPAKLANTTDDSLQYSCLNFDGTKDLDSLKFDNDTFADGEATLMIVCRLMDGILATPDEQGIIAGQNTSTTPLPDSGTGYTRRHFYVYVNLAGNLLSYPYYDDNAGHDNSGALVYLSRAPAFNPETNDSLVFADENPVTLLDLTYNVNGYHKGWVNGEFADSSDMTDMLWDWGDEPWLSIANRTVDLPDGGSEDWNAKIRFWAIVFYDYDLSAVENSIHGTDREAAENWLNEHYGQPFF